MNKIKEIIRGLIDKSQEELSDCSKEVNEIDITYWASRVYTLYEVLAIIDKEGELQCISEVTH